MELALFVPIGIRHVRPKRIAFRRDHCRTCERIVVAERVRTLMLLTLFWAPVLPIGVWRSWRCLSCTKVPHRPPRVRRGWKIALLLFSLAGVLSALLVAPRYEEPSTVVAIATLYGVVLLFSVVWLVRHRPFPPRAGGLAVLAREGHEPIHDCPFCARELSLRQLRPYCPDCDVVEEPVVGGRAL